MKNKICVVTSCTGDRDKLIEEQALDGARFVAYVDKISPNSIWEQRPAHANFVSARRNSRIHKILIHQYVNAEYSLWIDGNIRLMVPAERLVKEWLNGYDIAIFKHRMRDCIYDEADLCARLNLDNPDLIHEQVRAYLKDNHPRKYGLAEACVILRRHSPSVESFNNAWWSEYSRYSVRDQISLMVAARKSSVALNLITPTRFDHPYIRSEPRPPGLEHAASFPENVMDIC